MIKQFIFSVVLFLLSTTVALALVEIILHVKNSSMKNYDIEMWRYAKELKIPSADPKMGHDHVKRSEALLQSVAIRTNEWGLRGGPVEAHPSRRILFLGGSITLGWGVREENTVTARIQQILRKKDPGVEVLNGGVGNYNAERYVERFFHELEPLNPTDIVVQYFVRDAERLDSGGGNILLRNSELAVTLWTAISRLTEKTGEAALVQHYADVYRETETGFVEMKSSLRRLSDYARANNIRIYLAMTPDVHNLKHYQLGFIHVMMKQIAEEDGYQYVDLLPAFTGLAPEDVWAMPGDPHPNDYVHELMAATIAPLLSEGNSPIR
jgi:hypothetical protein